MSAEREKIEAAIQGLEAQRAVLGDAIVGPALVLLRANLAGMLAAESTSPVGTLTLRQATILFIDVVDSTTLTQCLAPEDIHSAMDGVLTRWTGIVELHGGRVLEYAGDGLLAVFGAVAAQEDDPERAIRAGLALLSETPLLREALRREHRFPHFDVRVGVHSGDVALAARLSSKNVVRGIAVNIAARMEQTAPAGALRISHDTYRHVRGIFDVEPQSPIEVKGLEQSVVTYLVRRAKPRAFRTVTRGIEGVETRMIGRNDELTSLQEGLFRAAGQHSLVNLLVIGEAGLGKSRLLYEFANWVETRPEAFLVFQGRATPQTQNQPYGLLRDIVAWRMQIADSDSMEAARLKIEHGIDPLFSDDSPSQAGTHLIGHLIGLDFSESPHLKGILGDGKQIRNRAFHALAQMFRHFAAKKRAPVILELDDLHWADEGSLDFLIYLAQANRDVPMLVLSLTRPVLFERRADWNSKLGLRQRIVLAPLGKGGSNELADELLKKLPEVPSALRALMIDGSEGNPFYMEELVKMLVDEGAIDTSAERWTVHAERLVATRVPPTLVGVLQARLDSLRPAERLALQQASVIGLTFWDRALAAVDADATKVLPSLVQRELIVLRPEASLDGTREYAFGHQILHQVTYETVLKPARRELHAKAAEWLANAPGSRASDFFGAIADHYRLAGDPANASAFYARAADHAKDRYAHESALSYVHSGLELLEQGSSLDQGLLRWQLIDARQRTLNQLGRRAEQRADIEALQQIADALDDDKRRIQVALRLSDFALRTADYQAMEKAARSGKMLAEGIGDLEQALRAQSLLSLALCQLGDAASAKALAQAGLAAAREKELRSIEAVFLNTLSVIAGAQGDQIGHLETIQEDLQLRRKLGDRHGEAIALSNLGFGWLLMGDDEQALGNLQEGLRLHRMVGNRVSEPHPLCHLSQLALRQGDAALALAHARSALEVSMEVRARDREVIALCCVGNAELALGRHEEAAASFEQAEAAARSIGHPFQNDASAGRARVALAMGDVAAAMLHVRPVLSCLSTGGTLDGTESRRLIQLTCYEVLSRGGDPSAAARLTEAHAELMARAATIADVALRKTFLNAVPEHRDIVAAWNSSAADSGSSRTVPLEGIH